VDTIGGITKREQKISVNSWVMQMEEQTIQLEEGQAQLLLETDYVTEERELSLTVRFKELSYKIAVMPMTKEFIAWVPEVNVDQ